MKKYLYTFILGILLIPQTAVPNSIRFLKRINISIPFINTIKNRLGISLEKPTYESLQKRNIALLLAWGSASIQVWFLKYYCSYVLYSDNKDSMIEKAFEHQTSSEFEPKKLAYFFISNKELTDHLLNTIDSIKIEQIERFLKNFPEERNSVYTHTKNQNILNFKALYPIPKTFDWDAYRETTQELL